MLDSLSLRYLTKHPNNAARDIERFNQNDTVELFSGIPADIAAAILANMTPVHCIQIMSQLSTQITISILQSMNMNVAAALLRRMPEKLRAPIFAQAEENEELAKICLLVEFPSNTVGAIMDPQVLVLHKSMDMQEIRHVLQFHFKQLPHEFYVIDEFHVLCGEVAARDLLFKEKISSLSKLIKPCVHTIFSRSRIENALDNSGWLEHKHLPVVDANGVLLGDLDKHVLQAAAASMSRQRNSSDSTREVLVGLADTFVSSFAEILTNDKQRQSR